VSGRTVQAMLARMMRTFDRTTGIAIAAMVLAAGVGQAAAGQGKEQRLTGAALVAHPVAALAAQYLDLIVKTTPATGSGAGTSTTVAIPFAMEGGKWKVAR